MASSIQAKVTGTLLTTSDIKERKVNIMEVKITTSDLKRLIEESESRAYYYDKLKVIAELFKANQHDKIKEILDGLFLGV